MKLSDTVIAHIAQLVQIAILTGTDIVDNMRMILLVNDEGVLELDEEYNLRIQENIKRMIDEAASLQGKIAE